MEQLRRLLLAVDDFQQRPRWLAPPPLGRPDEPALGGQAGGAAADQRVEVSYGDTDDGAGRLDQSS
jgi:hypothetical protein